MALPDVLSRSALILGFVAGAALIALWSHGVAARSTAASTAPPPGIAAPSARMVENPCPTPQSDGGWAALCRFYAENAKVAQGPRPRVVFMGDSITANWGGSDPAWFADGMVDRGISGQTSPQMLLRFYQDVVALHPQVVHIMAGTNDIAGNTGPSSPDQFKNNIIAMVTLAQANHISVILASIPPSVRFDWQPAINPAAQIVELNAWLKSYAGTVGAAYADYHSVLADGRGGMQSRYSADGVHPGSLGYAAMRPVAEAAIAHALSGAAH
jgi:lysophospholipase L1-like esterase